MYAISKNLKNVTSRLFFILSFFLSHQSVTLITHKTSAIKESLDSLFTYYGVYIYITCIKVFLR